jgi:hypothetical protein
VQMLATCCMLVQMLAQCCIIVQMEICLLDIAHQSAAGSGTAFEQAPCLQLAAGSRTVVACTVHAMVLVCAAGVQPCHCQLRSCSASCAGDHGIQDLWRE